MNFKPYIHIERFGHRQVQGIEHGECWVFPKLDGSNASVWMGQDDAPDSYAQIQAGSRTRKLSLANDNAGFLAWVIKQSKLIEYLQQHPNHRLYGEWLVPHTLRTYREDAWRRFWIYDVSATVHGREEGYEEFMSYEEYQPELERFGLDYIVPICSIRNINEEYLTGMLDRATFLVEDGKGHGEGVVLKNYDFYNCDGQQIWAKLVRQEFKDANKIQFGVPSIELGDPIERVIVEKFLTESMINKVIAKIQLDNMTEVWSTKFIPRLLDTCFYDLVTEELWSALKEFKNPTINFKLLKMDVIKRIKNVKKELF